MEQACEGLAMLSHVMEAEAHAGFPLAHADVVITTFSLNGCGVPSGDVFGGALVRYSGSQTKRQATRNGLPPF